MYKRPGLLVNLGRECVLQQVPIWFQVLSANSFQLCLTLATLWTVVWQAPVSIRFSRQEYWSGLPFLFQGMFLTQGSNPCLLHLLYWQEDSLPLSYLGNQVIAKYLLLIRSCFGLLAMTSDFGSLLPLVQSLSSVWLLVTPWIAAYQASLFFTVTQSVLKPMSIESVMPSNHFILCHPLLLPPSIFPSIRVFFNESAPCIRWPRYWSFSISISPFNKYSGLISFRMDLLDLLAAQGTLKSLL